MYANWIILPYFLELALISVSAADIDIFASPINFCLLLQSGLCNIKFFIKSLKSNIKFSEDGNMLKQTNILTNQFEVVSSLRWVMKVNQLKAHNILFWTISLNFVYCVSL